MAGEKDKKLVLGVFPYLLALITAFQHQFAIIYNLIFQTQQQRAMILHLSHTATISRFQIARRKIRRGPVCTPLAQRLENSVVSAASLL